MLLQSPRSKSETRKVWLYFQRLHALMHGLAVTPTHKASAISVSMISDNESGRLQSHEGRARSTTRTESGPLCHGRRLLSVTARPVLTGALVARNPPIVCTGGTAPTLVAQAAGTRHGYAPAAFPAIARPRAKGIMSSMIGRATSGPMMGKAAEIPPEGGPCAICNHSFSPGDRGLRHKIGTSAVAKPRPSKLSSYFDGVSR